MTMVPTPNVSLQLDDLNLLKAPNYAQTFCLFNIETNCVAKSDLTVDHMETEQDSLSTSRNNEQSSSPAPFLQEENWLQLGLARGGLAETQVPEQPPRTLVELDLLSDKPTDGRTPPSSVNIPSHLVHTPPFFFHQNGAHGFAGLRLRQQEYLWNFRQTAYPSSSWTVPYASQPAVTKPSPSSTAMKIVKAPPGRTNSGLWFALQAEQNQIRELALPQLQKSYLRIKDGKMTILLILKYLADKLLLDSESEVEIRCRGQTILPSFTLQHVRDVIWCARAQWMERNMASLPDTPTADHVMILNYARTIAYT